MRFLVQRVKEANVKVDKKEVGKIGRGYVVFVGITHNDDIKIADYMINKLLKLRIFSDENDKMNLSIEAVNGELLLVSQFTLYANCKGSNRPDFISSAKPDYANELYEYIVKKCREKINVQTGIFKANMEVSIINDGPVTINLDSDELISKKK